MSNVLSDLVVRLTIDDVGFVTGLKKSLFSAEAWKKQLTPTLGGMDKAFGTLIKSSAALATGIVSAGLAIGQHMVRHSLEAIDAMAKMSDRTGINIETLYGLKVASEDVGVSLESVTGAITKMQRNISEAVAGNENLRDSFSKVGLSADDLKNLKPEEAFGKVIDALNKVPNQADAVALKMQLMGKSANELTNLMALGSEGLAKYNDRAKELGITVNRFDAAKVEIANDAMTAFGTAVEGVGNRFAIGLTPFIKKAADQLTAFFTTGDHGQAIIDSIIDAGTTGFGYIADAVQTVRIAFAGLWLGATTISVVFYDILEAGAYTFKYLGGLIENIATFIANCGRNIAATFDLAWAATKLGVAKFVNFVTQQLVALLNQLAKTAGFFDNDLMTSMQTAAFDMGRSVGTFAADAEQNFDKVKEAAAKTGEETARSFREMGEVKVDNSAFEHMSEQAGKQFLEAHDKFFELLHAPWSSEAIKKWVKEAREAIVPLANDIAKAAPGEQTKKEETKPPVIVDEAWKKYQEDLAAKWMGIAEDQVFWERSKNDQIELMTKSHLQDIEREEAESQAKNNALWQQGLKGRLQIASSILSQLETLQNSKSRAMFEVGKAAAISNAIINTYQAATGAYSALAAIPIVGPALGAAAAAAAIVAGLNNVNNIRSTSFGSKGGGGGSSGGGGVSSSGVDASAKSGGGNGNGSTNTANIVLLGDSFGQKQIRGMIDQINSAVGDGARIKVTGG